MATQRQSPQHGYLEHRNLVGLGKYQSLAEFTIRKGLDILCLQETKSTSSDEILTKGGKYLLAGSPDDPSAGVGFYIPPRNLPLVQDFIPFSGRLAALMVRSTLRGNFFKFSKMQVSALFKVFGVNFHCLQASLGCCSALCSILSRNSPTGNI